MAFVPEFDYDVFISYSQVDDKPVQIESKDVAWISTLKDQLETRLGQEGLGRSVKVWRDLEDLGGNESLTPTLMDRVSNSAVLVVIMSPNYLNSEWCKKERVAFLEKANSDDRFNNRLFVVHYRNVPLTDRPDSLQDVPGFRFYFDEQDRKEFDPGSKRYRVELHVLVTRIAEKLKEMKEEIDSGHASAPAQPPRLAPPGSDRLGSKKTDAVQPLADPAKLIKFVNRGEQKDAVTDAVRRPDSPSPLVFLVRSSPEQLVDDFKFALERKTIPEALACAPTSSERQRGIFKFTTVRWSRRTRGMEPEKWLRLIADQVVIKLKANLEMDAEAAIQTWLNLHFEGEQSFYGIEYNLEESDLRTSADIIGEFCGFWSRFSVSRGRFVILLKVETESHGTKSVWARLGNSFSWLFRGSSRVNKATSVRDLEELGDVTKADARTWWGSHKDQLSSSSALNSNPGEEIFESGETGISMKEFRNRVTALMGRHWA